MYENTKSVTIIAPRNHHAHINHTCVFSFAGARVGCCCAKPIQRVKTSEVRTTSSEKLNEGVGVNRKKEERNKLGQLAEGQKKKQRPKCRCNKV